MKRIYTLGLISLLVLSCAFSSGSEENKADKKVLVAYFSATGSTERVARYIASATNGDLFELEPKNSYTSADLNWREATSRVNQEHGDESKRNIELINTTPDNWEQYDTVFIGYPIWWGIAAWPVNGFVTGNDFDGKTVIPFCTSLSSSLGNSVQLLSRLSNGGNWQSGQRFRSNAGEKDVTSWVNGLNY